MQRYPLRVIMFCTAAAALLSALGCGPDYAFKKAQLLEKEGYCVEASVKYEELSKKHPSHPIAPEALYRIGTIYRTRLKMYSHAHRYYDELIARYPKAEPWAAMAQLGLFNSPDYHPLRTGSFWIEGDSVSGGRNMRSEWNCREVSSGTFEMQRRISAGSRLVTTLTRYYEKKNLELHEYENAGKTGSPTVILSYPFATGRTWNTVRSGKKVVYAIVAEDLTLKVAASDFYGCIKVSEEYPGLSGSKKYNYYAPGVGWILTTIGAEGREEHRNTELLSYKIIPE